MSVTNQKIVTINKAKSNKQNIYGIVNVDAAQRASKALKAGGFKLWVYFNLQQDGYRFELSSKHLKDTWGINIRQYNSAIHELIEAGYLIQKNEKSNLYTFNEKAEPIQEKEEKEEKVEPIQETEEVENQETEEKAVEDSDEDNIDWPF